MVAERLRIAAIEGSVSRPLTVALADAYFTPAAPSTSEAAFTVETPVVSTPGTATFARASESKYGGGAEPEAVGSATVALIRPDRLTSTPAASLLPAMTSALAGALRVKTARKESRSNRFDWCISLFLLNIHLVRQ